MGRQVSSDLVGGAISTPLENDGVKVSWDDDSQYIYIRIYIYMESHKNHVPVTTNQIVTDSDFTRLL
jgi:hypothetical protein